MKIAIFASIWAQNLWDELILKNEIKLLEKRYSEKAKFYVFSYDKKNPFFKQNNIKYFNFFPNWIRNPFNFFSNLLSFLNLLLVVIRSDLIVIWWWWIIYDNELQSNKNPLDSWIFRRRLFRFFLKKVYFFRVWINIINFNNDINYFWKESLDERQIIVKNNLKKVKKIFSWSYEIEVRDTYSFELLKNIWINSVIKEDPVFYDRWEFINTKFIIWSVSSYYFDKNIFDNFDLLWKKIWLAIRAWYFFQQSNISSRMEEWKVRELINFLVSKWASVVLLPHSFHEFDEIANDFLFLTKFVWEEWVSIKENMLWVYDTYKNKEIDICISMRLHSIILSHVYEIPFIALSYSTKTDEVLKKLKK